MKYVIEILVIVLAGTFFWQNRQIRKYKDTVQVQAVEFSSLNDSVLTLKTKTGQLYSKISSIEVDQRNLKDALELAGVDIQTLREQNVRWRKITNALKLELQAARSGETATIDTFYIENTTTDTVWYTRVDNWTNDYLSLYNARVQNKRLTFDYKYNVGINLIIEGTRKVPVVTATLADPNANITHGNSISVPHKTKWYERPLIWAAAGLAGGYFIAK